MLRRQSLMLLLERHGYLRVTLRGLINDYPTAYQKIRTVYKEVEAYELFDIIENQSDQYDTEFMIYVKHEKLPHIFEIKKHYSLIECKVISDKTAIPLQEFIGIIEAVGL